MSIDAMVKKLQEDIKKVENFDDANGRLDIASMNKVCHYKVKKKKKYLF